MEKKLDKKTGILYYLPVQEDKKHINICQSIARTERKYKKVKIINLEKLFKY